MSDSSDSPAAPGAATGASLSAIVVTHESAAALRSSLPALLAELRDGDELIVCDNGSGDGTPELIRELAPDATMLEAGDNLGFGAGSNRAAARSSNDLLLFLNPDNVVAPGFRDAIELPLIEGRGWDAWQGVVTDRDGEILNTRGGVVHFTGIAWAGGAGRSRSEAPSGPSEIAFPSGACLAIRRPAWERLGGFSEPYFLYHEDADLGLRVWLGGGRCGLEPRALSDHAYDFDKGPAKWRYLERNRWATIIRTYPTRLLIALMPALIATELALLPAAAAGGWLGEKLRADRELLRWLPRLLSERRTIQAEARIDAAGFARSCLTADLDSEYLGRASRSAPLRSLLRAYWGLARRLL